MATTGERPGDAGPGAVRAGKARKATVRILVLLALIAFAMLAAVAVAAFDARDRLSALGRRPVSIRASSGRLPPLPLEAVRQSEVDNGLVHNLLRQRPAGNRYAFIVRYNAYALAMPLLGNARGRRDLFARLPCGVRPRLLKRLREN